MRAEAPLLAAPDVVRDADRRHGQQARLGDGDEPADEREPQPAVVAPLRPECQQDVAELPAAVDEAAQIARGGAVFQRQAGLPDAELRVHRVGGHCRLAAEAGSEREDSVARLLGQTPLPRERLLRRIARLPSNQAAGGLLRDPEAATLLLGEGGDRQVAVAVEQRPRGRRGDRRRRAGDHRAPLRARRASAPVLSPGAGAERRGRRHPRRRGRLRRASRRRRRSPAPPEIAAAAPRWSSRSAFPRRAPRSGSSGAHPPAGGSGSIDGRIPLVAVSRMP